MGGVSPVQKLFGFFSVWCYFVQYGRCFDHDTLWRHFRTNVQILNRHVSAIDSIHGETLLIFQWKRHDRNAPSLYINQHT